MRRGPSAQSPSSAAARPVQGFPCSCTSPDEIRLPKKLQLVRGIIFFFANPKYPIDIKISVNDIADACRAAKNHPCKL